MLKGEYERVGAGIVESHSIDEGLFGNESEHPWKLIARLAMSCDPIELGEPESQSLPNGNSFCELVHASGESHGIGKSKAEGFDRQFRCREQPMHASARQAIAAGTAEHSEGPVVNPFGVLKKQEGAEGSSIQPAHGSGLAGMQAVGEISGFSGPKVESGRVPPSPAGS